MRFTGGDATDTGSKANDLHRGNPVESSTITKLAIAIFSPAFDSTIDQGAGMVRIWPCGYGLHAGAQVTKHERYGTICELVVSLTNPKRTAGSTATAVAPPTFGDSGRLSAREVVMCRYGRTIAVCAVR